jgi:hypothetical protein
MNKLYGILNDLEQQVQFIDSTNPTISSVSVGWHIDHSCLVIIKIVETIKKADPLKYKPTFSFMKQLVFLLGKFPRGKAKAPSAVLPVDSLNREGLIIQIEKARTAINELNSCSKNQFFSHPIFGQLNVAVTQQFFCIHTKHHLSIIKDILK